MFRSVVDRWVSALGPEGLVEALEQEFGVLELHGRGVHQVEVILAQRRGRAAVGGQD
jgi:hypothetical protein